MNKSKEVVLTPEEQGVIVNELEDVKDHFQALLEDEAIDNDIEKEEMINRIDVIDNVIRKLT